MANGFNILLANRVSTFLINGKPTFIICIISDSWIFDNFIFTDYLFAKALWRLETYQTIVNYVEHLVWSYISGIIVTYLHLLNCELDNFSFTLLQY